MSTEAPQFKRCCFCIPLRHGLIGWGYAKLIVSVLILIYLITTFCIKHIQFHRYYQARDIAIVTFILRSCLATDVAFNIVITLAGHQKRVNLLRVSYIYNLVWLGLLLIGDCFEMSVSLYYMYNLWGFHEDHMYILSDVLLIFSLAFSGLFIQIYLILLIRSEMRKLRHQSLEMQFSNHLASGEAQCTLHNANMADKNEYTNDNAQVNQNCTDENAHVMQKCTKEDEQVVQDCTDENTRKVQVQYARL